MSPRRRPPRSGTLLPPYLAVLAVDAEKYSRTSSYHQRILNGMVRDVLEEAFGRSGLAEQWRTARFPQSTGDGYLVGIDPRYLPLLLHPLLHHVQEILEGCQPELASLDRELRLRLRASIEVGPLPDSGGAERGDGIGRPMNETHRLLDSEAVRAALSRSDPEITLVAAIISRRVYEDAVLGGYTGLNERRFSPAQVHLPEKDFQTEGYLYIPELHAAPNTDMISAAPAEAASAAPDPPARPAGETTPGATHRARDNSGRLVQSGDVHGGVHMGDTTSRDHQRGGVGGIAGDVGTVVTDPQAPVHTGGGEQINGPQFHNRGGVNYVAGTNTGTVRGDTAAEPREEAADGKGEA